MSILDQILGPDVEKADEELNYYFRDWLNKDDGTAFIEVDITEYRVSERRKSSFSANVSIKDCSRQMTLEFYCYNEADRVARMHKLNMLIDQITKVKERLEKFEFKDKLPKVEEEKPKKKRKSKDA